MFDWNDYRQKVEAAASTLEEPVGPKRFMAGVLIAERDPNKDSFGSDEFCWMRAPGVRRSTCLKLLAIFCERMLTSAESHYSQGS